jgi:hypothetical protein
VEAFPPATLKVTVAGDVMLSEAKMQIHPPPPPPPLPSLTAVEFPPAAFIVTVPAKVTLPRHLIRM